MITNNHPSILTIKKLTHKCDSFSFQHISKEKITRKMKKLDSKKIIQSTYILFLSSFFSDYFYDNINECIPKGEYADDFKHAEVRPFYKKDGTKEKSN